jgi:hypothetical protein
VSPVKGPKDPVEHSSRTTRLHAGKSVKDNTIIPAIVEIGVAPVLFVACLGTFAATKHSDIGLTLTALCAAGFVIGAVSPALVRRIE